MRWIWLTAAGVLSILLPMLVLGDRTEISAAPGGPEEHLYTGELPELDRYSEQDPAPEFHVPDQGTAPLQVSDRKENKSVCASGCSLDKHPKPFLTLDRFQELLKEYAELNPAAESKALDELLYHDAQVREYLETEGADLLQKAHLSNLKREAARTHVLLSARIVDEHGVVRGEKLETRVPLEEKQHLHFDKRVRLQGFEVNGTVKRVGLHYLWSRW